MSYDIKNLAGLSYLEGGDVNSPDKIILLHGYGADMFDLATLSEVVKPRKNFHWIFPNGTMEVAINHNVSGRAWFPIDFEAFTRAMQSGMLTKRVPNGLDVARLKVEKFLKALNFDWNRTYLGGFSQGSMLALDIVCETDITPKGMVLLSSTLLNEDRWGPQMALKKGMKYYQSHGEADQVLPASAATQLHEKMEASGWDGAMTLFRGGHEIPSKVIQEMASFLQ